MTSQKGVLTRIRGAISVEYIIILVLIAVGGILGFMLLGGQARTQMKHIIAKFAGSETTDTTVDEVQKDSLDNPVTMTGGEGGQSEEIGGEIGGEESGE